MSQTIHIQLPKKPDDIPSEVWIKLKEEFQKQIQEYQKKLDEMSLTAKKDDLAWVFWHGEEFLCYRCGDRYKYGATPRIDMLAAMMKVYAKEHKRCKPHPEGDMCSSCWRRGHTAYACPKREVSTPEEWWNGSDTGLSSMTIWCHMTNRWRRMPHAYEGSFPTPADSWDFGRCYRLLKLFPEWRARMPEMARLKGWEKVASSWSDLEQLYLECSEDKHNHPVTDLLTKLRTTETVR